ncbi:hypothetical protein B7P43_G09706, partial [Cryptotermes secundus]
KIRNLIVKKCKPFTEGELVKERFLEIADNFLKDLKIRKGYYSVHSCFGSTYLCESAFSYLKMTKSKQRSNMTDEHLQDCMKLALTQHSPDFP